MHSELIEVTVMALGGFLGGLILIALRQPPLVGYILAGIVLGPSCSGLISSRESVSVLAEMGVLMLLFLIGLELSLMAFRKVWVKAVSFVLLQLIGCALVIWAMSFWIGQSGIGFIILTASIVGISSTAVAIKILEDIGELRTEIGKIAVGILIAQDLAVIPILIIARNLNSSTFDFTVIFKVIFSVAFLAMLIKVLSRKERLCLPFKKIVENNYELTSCMALVSCFGAALLSGLVGLSLPYGAFIAGLVLGGTSQRASIIEATKPVQTPLLMVFFLSIGVLLDISFIIDNCWLILCLLIFITIGKSALNIYILKILKYSGCEAFLVGITVSQMGEFSFILASIGLESSILDNKMKKIIVGVTVLSLVVSPLWLTTARQIQTFGKKGSLSDLIHKIYEIDLLAIKNVFKCIGKIFKRK